MAATMTSLRIAANPRQKSTPTNRHAARQSGATGGDGGDPWPPPVCSASHRLFGMICPGERWREQVAGKNVKGENGYNRNSFGRVVRERGGSLEFLQCDTAAVV